MTKSRHPQTDPTRVSFRLDPETALELARRANAAGKSHGTFARDLLYEALFQTEEQRQQLTMIRAELARVSSSIDRLHYLPNDFASTVVVLLTHAGKLKPEQARQWVQQTLNHPKPPEEQ